MEKRNEIGKIIVRKCEKTNKSVTLTINSNQKKKGTRKYFMTVFF
jgi:hypothetical protein